MGVNLFQAETPVPKNFRKTSEVRSPNVRIGNYPLLSWLFVFGHVGAQEDHPTSRLSGLGMKITFPQAL